MFINFHVVHSALKMCHALHSTCYTRLPQAQTSHCIMKHKVSSLSPTWQHLVIKRIYYLVTFLFRFHSGKSDSSANSIWFAQYPCGDDRPVFFEHILKILFHEVNWKIGNVQVGRVLFLLLLTEGK